MNIDNIFRKIQGFFTPAPTFTELVPKGSPESAGFDLAAVDGALIPPGKVAKIRTNVFCEFNPGWVALLWDRSSLASKGLHIFGGVIDSDYRGEWLVLLYNSTDEEVAIGFGQRIAQVIFQRCWTGRIKYGRLSSTTERGSKGFGSSG